MTDQAENIIQVQQSEVTRQGTNLMRHLNTVSNALNKTIEEIQNNPSRCSSLGEELGRVFGGNLQSQQQMRDRRNRGERARKTPQEDGRVKNHVKMHLFCFQSPDVKYTNTNLRIDHLSSLGLGVPISERTHSNTLGRQKTNLMLSWSANEFKEFIYTQFPPLRGYDFEMMYSVAGGLLKAFPSEINTPDKIKVFLVDIRRTPGTLFIRPCSLVTISSESTCPHSTQNSTMSTYLQMEDLEEEVPNRAESNERQIMPQENMNTDQLPEIRYRSRRPAAITARNTIRGWCNPTCQITVPLMYETDNSIRNTTERQAQSNIHPSYEELMEGLEENISYQSSDEESEPEIVTSVIPPANDSEVRTILMDWLIKEVRLSEEQRIAVSRRPESLWEHSLRCFQRQLFDVHKKLVVQFRNESGQDEGGLRREYLEILFRQMLQSPYMNDTGKGIECSFNTVGVVNKTFFTLGKMLATILIQGGPVVPCLSHHMVQSALHDISEQDISLESVEEPNARDLIQQIENGDVNDEILTMMENAGIHMVLNNNTKKTIVNALKYHHSKYNKLRPMMEEFWKGTEELGLRSLLRRNPGLENILCRECGSLPTLNAQELMDMFSVQKFGSARSNRRHRSEDATQHFENFLFDCEESKCSYHGGDISLHDVLKFITGCSSTPPAGFDTKFYIIFTEDICYPSVSTCTFTLKLPLHFQNYSKFKEVMIESIVSGPGFGNV